MRRNEINELFPIVPTRSQSVILLKENIMNLNIREIIHHPFVCPSIRYVSILTNIIIDDCLIDYSSRRQCINLSFDYLAFSFLKFGPDFLGMLL